MKQLMASVTLVVTLAALTACGAATGQAPTAVGSGSNTIASDAASASPVMTLPASAEAQEGPRTLTVMVGGGQDTEVVKAYLPTTTRIRVGDSITWTINSDEPHSVTFTGGEPLSAGLLPLPGGKEGELMFNPQHAFPSRKPGDPIEIYRGEGFASSGLLSKQPSAPDAPPNDSFTLTFDTPGSYTYLCVIHPGMGGVVEVVPPTAGDVPSQEQLDAQAKAELAALMPQFDAIHQAGEQARNQAAKDGSRIWHVKAGATLGDSTVEAYAFLPQEHKIKAGDTVVWTSASFHDVAFVPAPPAPEFLLPQPQPDGPPLLQVNPQVLLPAEPAPVYDPTKLFNSGIFGPDVPTAGNSWALTFETPGTYTYYCPIHRSLGMQGTITVEPR